MRGGRGAAALTAVISLRLKTLAVLVHGRDAKGPLIILETCPDRSWGALLYKASRNKREVDFLPCRLALTEKNKTGECIDHYIYNEPTYQETKGLLSFESGII